MIRNLIMSGGPAHDYSVTSSILADALSEVDIESQTHEDFRIIENGGLLGFDLLTLNCARWTCNGNPAWQDEWRFELSRNAREVILNYLDNGGGLLAIHAAPIGFDDWWEYRAILGAWWEWGYSCHSPVQEHEIRVAAQGQPLTEDIGAFVVTDELYSRLRLADSVDPLMEAEWEDQVHPVLWTREYGGARICYNALGHGVEAFEHPVFQTLIQRGASWAAKQH